MSNHWEDFGFLFVSHFFGFTYVPDLSVPLALLRILGVGVTDRLLCLPVCLMASFITPSLQGAWGTPDSLLYLSLRCFCDSANFLHRHWVIRARQAEAVCVINACVNVGLCVSGTAMPASFQRRVGTTFTW